MTETIKERPILFSAPMVRALLDGSKTQTRRVVKPVDLARAGADGVELWTGFMGWQSAEAVLADQSLSTNKQTRCPYGQPGYRLWVRETWAQPAALDPGPTVYRADYPACVPAYFTNLPAVDEITWKPSIHMFRRDSRILLEILSVRVARLNDCSEADARAEGVLNDEVRQFTVFGMTSEERADVRRRAAVAPFERLWESINGAGSWAANPWVWVVEFKQIHEGGRKTNADDN